MNIKIYLALLFCLLTPLKAYSTNKLLLHKTQKRILLIDSYHKNHQWSQITNKGFCETMLKFGYFDNKNQITEFNNKDYFENSKIIIKRLWMNSKIKKRSDQKKESTNKIMKLAYQFKPDIVILGDDNATRYIGDQYLGTNTPVVFWGVNGSPLKYDLIDSLEKPLYNVTGVYDPTLRTQKFNY